MIEGKKRSIKLSPMHSTMPFKGPAQALPAGTNCLKASVFPDDSPIPEFSLETMHGVSVWKHAYLFLLTGKAESPYH